MRIAEIYKSFQGEGFLTGTESVFVRTSGCNLRCWYCDTPYTSWHPEGAECPVEEVLARVIALGGSHVVVTGGEPMLFTDLISLCDGLRSAHRHITIETAGTLYLQLKCDLMSISPKLSSSAPTADRAREWRGRHQRIRRAPAVINQLVEQYTYQFKFVVDTYTDCDEVHEYLGEFPAIDRRRVMLMPQGTDSVDLRVKARWLRPYCRKHGLHFCPRKHIEWYGLQRGT